MIKNYYCHIVLFILLVCFCYPGAAQLPPLEVSVSKFRVQTGDTVVITIDASRLTKSRTEPLQASLLRPSLGSETLTLEKVTGQREIYRGAVYLEKDVPEGLYIVHAWSGDRRAPSSTGKTSFLYGKIYADFFIASYLDTIQPVNDIKNYLQAFHQLGGNFIIAHGLITPEKAYFPSQIAKTNVTPGSPNDGVELLLSEASRRGFAVLLSVSWDLTKNSHYKDRMAEITAIMAELYRLYQHHPALAGFYSYQEGSGTYFVPYIREFCQQVKSLNPGLLSACAPHIDDPLLAGYLSTVNDLDILIWQGAVMASYRTDNRKKYPVRRARDFEALGAGAKRLQNKLAVMHVELFGYLENRPDPEIIATSYENIYRQILSVATVSASDGISLFAYHPHIYMAMKKHKRVSRSRQAVVDGLKAFRLITSKVSFRSNPIALYFPYSDWVVERWTNCFLPALDAFRSLGVPLDILPYAPPLEESIYPYYPFHKNDDVLVRLLRERTVLVFANISGFQKTDSDLIKSYVEQGGVVIAFGPQIPMGRSYERRELFGGQEVGIKSHSRLIVKNPVGNRVPLGEKIYFPQQTLPAWESIRANVIACYEDGTAAILANTYRKGKVFTILPDAVTAVHSFPELIRDILDAALPKRGEGFPVDIIGLNENTDLATVKTENGFRATIINHNADERIVTIHPRTSGNTISHSWFDLVLGKKVDTTSKNLILTIPPHSYRCIEFRQGKHSR